MKKYMLQAFAAAFCLSSGVFMASCGEEIDSPIDPKQPVKEEKTTYVVAAKGGETSYLLTANSLDEGTVSVAGNGTEVEDGGSYWIYKDLEYVFSFAYHQGSNGTGGAFYVDANGKVQKRYKYEFNRFTSYGTWKNEVITVSTGDTNTKDAEGNTAQGLLFNYLSSEDGSQTEGRLLAENFLGNGERITWAGFVEANNRLYTSVIPTGMSIYGVKKWPEMVTDRELVAKKDGGSRSSSYKKGEIPTTQYPDSAYIAIYNDKDFTKKPVIVKTDKIGNAYSRMKSQFYQTIRATDNGDLYVFSSGFGRTAVSTDELKRVTGQKPSGVVRIKAGQTEFDPNYYYNLEAVGEGKPMFRCWYISGDYFLLQLYKDGLAGLMGDSRTADVNELAIFKAESGELTPVTGLPADAMLGGEPYVENGYAYMGITVKSGDKPAFYKIDAKTGKAVKGLTVDADGIMTVGKLKYHSK